MTEIKFLSDELVCLLKSKVEWLLRHVGVKTECFDLRRRFKLSGAIIDDNDLTVKLPPELLHELLSGVPKTFAIRDMLGNKTQIGNGGQTALGLIVDPNMVDSKTQKLRSPILSDVYRNTAINSYLPEVSITCLMDLPMSDIPGPHSSRKALEVYLMNNHKAMTVDCCSVGLFDLWRDLLPILSDNDDSSDTSLFIMLTSIISPLLLSKNNSDMIRFSAENNMILHGATCPIAGATSPYSQAASVVQSVAENLFMIAVSQIYKPGARSTAGTGISLLNMKDGNCIYSPPDKIMWKLASVEIQRLFGLPVSVEVGGTLGFRPDIQTGAESFSQALFAVLGGADILSGLGGIYNAVGMSSESIIYQSEWVRYAAFLRNGFTGSSMNNLDEALQSISTQGPGGNFLDDDLTIMNLRSGEFFEDGLFDYNAQSDGKSMFERCRDKADEIESNHVSKVPGHIREQLERLFRQVE